MAGNREFDIVVYGATGFTGRLVAEHMLAVYGASGDITWAMAGRSKTKLAEVRDLIGAPASTPLIAADSSDPASLKAMAERAKVIVSTVGPYQLYGEGLIAACAETGTDYVDLCGEPAWMQAMIVKYGEKARASGARIVFSCGFDSIPFDLGVFYLQKQAQTRTGVPFKRVLGRMRKMKGSFSGGTAASLLATVEAAQRDPKVTETMGDPFALTPGFVGPAQPSGDEAIYDKALESWSAPFVMAAINTKNVHRSNALLNHPYGKDFAYNEMMMTGDGDKGRKAARALAQLDKVQRGVLGFGPTRALLRAFVLPKPGQGPSKKDRETGFFDAVFVGEREGARSIRVSVKGDKDPGYGSTSKMIAESAACLARDVSRDQTQGGVWTPAAAMGDALIARLQANAGLTFAVENV